MPQLQIQLLRFLLYDTTANTNKHQLFVTIQKTTMVSSEASTKLSATAAERDRQAEAYFGRDNYELYEQCSAKVIALRAAAAPAAQPARSNA